MAIDLWSIAPSTDIILGDNVDIVIIEQIIDTVIHQPNLDIIYQDLIETSIIYEDY